MTILTLFGYGVALFAVLLLLDRLPWRHVVAFWGLAWCAAVASRMLLAPDAPDTAFVIMKATVTACGSIAFSFEPMWRRLSERTMRGLAFFAIGSAIALSMPKLVQEGAWPAALAAGLLILVLVFFPTRWEARAERAGGTMDLGWWWIVAYSLWLPTTALEIEGINLLGRKVLTAFVLLGFAARLGPQHWLRLRIFEGGLVFLLTLALPGGFAAALDTPGWALPGHLWVIGGLSLVAALITVWRAIRRRRSTP
ncbi:MAG: hypothetical protein H6739_38565 [Alphaproteobacteria bacterium]|nr:hypothetical protein [Alphaproteobacteria bacterium]